MHKRCLNKTFIKVSRKILFAVIFLAGFFLTGGVCAQAGEHPSDDSSTVERTAIRNLIKERQQLYGQYQSQIEKRSGIFGNQTKNDIRKANDILQNLIATDTRIFMEMENIMREKERNLGTKKFENISKEYDLANRNQKLIEYNATIEKLTRSLEEAKKINQSQKAKLGVYQFLSYLALILILVFPGYRFIKSRFGTK